MGAGPGEREGRRRKGACDKTEQGKKKQSASPRRFESVKTVKANTTVSKVQQQSKTTSEQIPTLTKTENKKTKKNTTLKTNFI